MLLQISQLGLQALRRLRRLPLSYILLRTKTNLSCSPMPRPMTISNILPVQTIPSCDLLHPFLIISPTDLSGVQVTISSTSTTSPATMVRASTPRLGVRSLPPNVRRSFSEDFAPCVITEMGCSTLPWSKLSADIVQGHVNSVYPGYDYAVERGGAFHTVVSSCTSPLNISQNPSLADQ